MANSTILSADRETELRKPIDEYVGNIQAQIDALRMDGTDKVVNIQNDLDNLKRDRIYTAQEKAEREAKLKADLEKARAVEAQNKAQVAKLIDDAEVYLKVHYDSEYYQYVVASCKEEKVAAQRKYEAAVAKLKSEHEAAVAKLSDPQGDQGRKVRPQEPPVRRQDVPRQGSAGNQGPSARRLRPQVSPDRHAAAVQVHLRRGHGPALGELQIHLQHPRLPAEKRSVHRHRHHLHRAVHHHPHRQERAAADRQQCSEHPAAGFAPYVPGIGRCRSDPSGRH